VFPTSFFMHSSSMLNRNHALDSWRRLVGCKGVYMVVECHQMDVSNVNFVWRLGFSPRFVGRQMAYC
jgi:hypothetical protein